MRKIVSSAILIILIIQIASIALATEITEQEEKELINEKTIEENINQSATEEIESPDEDNDENVTWTDFSNALITVSKNGVAGACIEVSEVVPLENHAYYLCITNSNNVNINDINENDLIILEKAKEGNKLTSVSSKIAQNLELNQDVYGTIIEKIVLLGEKKIVVSPTKFSRWDESENYDAFFSSHMTYNNTQIITTFTHSTENNRKLEIKIGKITDNQILKKIQGKDASGFSDLMTYAKSQKNSLYNNTTNAEENYYTIAYVTSNNNREAIKLNGLEDKEYYYLYVKTDDEDGKYISNEAVTLAQSSTYKDGSWYMFFYGTDDFKWKTFETTGAKDPTAATGNYPYTGKIAIGTGIVMLIGATYVLHRKNKAYKDIK